MNCIIIDDEPLAINVIKSYCQNVGGVNVIKTFTNAIEALEFVNSNEVALVFTDIEMPQINGVDFIKVSQKKPMFIFTTAYPEYALEGFELNVVDYLVKPIPFPRFIKAVNKAKNIYKDKAHKPINLNITSHQGIELSNEKPFLFIKSDYGNTKVNIDEILYIQGLKDYLKIHLKNQKAVLTLMNFKEMESRLSKSDFFRIHRSYLINIHFVETVQKSKVLIMDEKIPIGASYKNAFFERIGIY